MTSGRRGAGGLALTTLALLCVAGFGVAADEEDVRVRPRTPDLQLYPCNSCHAHLPARDATDPPRPPHSATRLDHMRVETGCYACHQRDARNFLRLLTTDEQVSFDESHVLCGQCHGEKKRDWQLGIHTQQTGSWNGSKVRVTCVGCHDAHAPRRKAMKSEPAPQRPDLGIVKPRAESRTRGVQP